MKISVPMPILGIFKPVANFREAEEIIHQQLRASTLSHAQLLLTTTLMRGSTSRTCSITGIWMSWKESHP